MKSYEADCVVRFCQLNTLLCTNCSLSINWPHIQCLNEIQGQHKRVQISATMSSISPNSCQTYVLSFKHTHTGTPQLSFYVCVRTPILPPLAKLSLITFVTTRGPTPATATKAIFSLATAMTHFLPHYKATSLACSQMV